MSFDAVGNRMLTANTLTGSISYTYDAGGIRQSQTENGTVTHYLVDPNQAYHQVIEELNDLQIAEVIYSYGDDLINQQRPEGNFTYGYDGLGSTRILTDTTGTVQNSYGYQAFGESDYQIGSIPNNYLFTGEQYDHNVGFYYLRARYYNPSIGRFSQMDTFPGMQFEPKSLHKYLYTHADPINNIDPSGNISLSQTGVAQNLQSILLGFGRTIGSLMRVYDTFHSVGTFIELLGAIKQITGILEGNTPQNSGDPFVPRVNYREAMKSFGRNLPKLIGKGIGDWSEGISKVRQKNHGIKPKSFLIFMPTPPRGGLPPFEITTGMKVNFIKTRVPIKLRFGSTGTRGGQLFGVGINMKGRRQLFRMDYGPLAENHGGPGSGPRPKSYEIDVWGSGNFHYHVNKWNQDTSSN